MKVGITCAKLSKTGVARGNKTMKIGGVIMEAFEERQGKDPDIQRDLTEFNEYEGYTSGKALLKDINSEVKAENKRRKANGERALQKKLLSVKLNPNVLYKKKLKPMLKKVLKEMLHIMQLPNSVDKRWLAD